MEAKLDQMDGQVSHVIGERHGCQVIACTLVALRKVMAVICVGRQTEGSMSATSNVASAAKLAWMGFKACVQGI
jgi:hypothetical protein